MYEKFYGLQAKPFRLSPEPRCFFTSATHNSALAYLRYGLYQGEGFIVVTGAAGTGKTTLVRTLSGKVAGRQRVVGELVNTQLQANDLLRAIAGAFQLAQRGTKSDLINRLYGFLLGRAQKDQRVLLVVDEAHNLPPSSFEELRMLSNFQHGARSLLQCILLGQPPLRDVLAHSALQQRVIATHHLEPLLPEETRGYILHRLRYVGWRGDPSFSGAAIGLIHGLSHGIPRRINALCDRLLLFGCLEERHEFDVAAVARVHAEWVTEAGLEHDAADADACIDENLGALGAAQAAMPNARSSAPFQADQETVSLPPPSAAVADASASFAQSPEGDAPDGLGAPRSFMRSLVGMAVIVVVALLIWVWPISGILDRHAVGAPLLPAVTGSVATMDSVRVDRLRSANIAIATINLCG
ncbi:MAG: AAA family ATPase [Pseudomonadota bacterium]